MVVHYLYLRRSALCPNETDAVLVVDSDAVLPLPISSECLQLIPWWNSEIVKGDHRVKLVELASRHCPRRFWTGAPSCSRIHTVEDILCPIDSK